MMTMEQDHQEEPPRWHAIVDDTLKELAQMATLREMFQPVKRYVDETVERISLWMWVLVGLQILLVLLMLGDFLINLRSTVFVQAAGT